MILVLPNTESGIARVTFEIERVDYGAPEASGKQGGVQAGWPLWAASFELDRSDPDSADLWRAFVSRLRGRIRRFYCGEPTRPFPKAYPAGFTGMVRAGGGAFSGAATGWSQTINAAGEAAMTLQGLPANLAIGVGDYIGFKWDAAGSAAGTYERRTVARAVTATVANGAGTAVVTCEPPLNTALVPPGAIAHLDRPQCVMQLVPERSNLGPISSGGTLGGGVLVGIQDLRP